MKLDCYDIPLNKADDIMINRFNPKTSERYFYKIYNRLNISTFAWKGKNYGFQKKGQYPKIKELFKKKDIYLDGYWASEYYFSDYSTEIRDIFTLKDEIISEIDSGLIAEIMSLASVSIHVRRGDYVHNKFFHNLGLDYFYKAVEYIKRVVKNPVFFVFSDDLKWVKENFGLDTKNVNYIDNNYDGCIDLYLMSLCKHNIIANSTFSWWGAYLNKNKYKVVIAPLIWYDNYNAQKYYSDNSKLIPRTWLKM